MLGLLCGALFGGMAVHDSVKRSSIASDRRTEALRNGQDIYIGANGKIHHAKTGKPCIIKYSGYKGAIYKDYNGNILGISGQPRPEDIKPGF